MAKSMMPKQPRVRRTTLAARSAITGRKKGYTVTGYDSRSTGAMLSVRFTKPPKF